VGISLEESLRMASTYPAKVANIELQFGKIEKGFVADLTVLSKERTVEKVMRNGMFVS
jgi:N-acetylglucosamine-6-phosphate deacetylase